MNRNYLNKDLGEPPVTFYDKVQRKDAFKRKSSFQKRLTKRGEVKIDKSKEYKVCITGNSTFNDYNLFSDQLSKILKKQPDVIVNFTINEIDNMSANYALNNKLKSVEVVPDQLIQLLNTLMKLFYLLINQNKTINI